MAHFAKLNQNNIVIEVIVVNNEVLKDSNGIEQEQLGINFLINWSGGYTNWKQTSYNNMFRANFAGKDYYYDNINDVFIPPKPYPSWILNQQKWIYEAPVSKPIDNDLSIDYIWNEDLFKWQGWKLDETTGEPILIKDKT